MDCYKLLPLLILVLLGTTRTRNPNPDPNTLVGAGFGLLWQMGNSLTARIDWGIPLVDVDVEKDSLNDSGVYFNVNYTF